MRLLRYLLNPRRRGEERDVEKYKEERQQQLVLESKYAKLKKEDPQQLCQQIRKTSGEVSPNDKDDYIKKIDHYSKEISNHLKIILKTTKCSAHLYIFELESGPAVYVAIDKYREALTTLDSIISSKSSSLDQRDGKRIEECFDVMLSIKPDMFNKDFLEHIQGPNEEIENMGKNLRDKLIPPNIQTTLNAELKTDKNKIKDVWIFSEQSDIGYLWEWIYWESGPRSDKFFWGDRFHICRIPNDIAGKIFKKLTCNIENGVTIIDTSCTSADTDSALFEGLPNWVIIKLQREKDLDKLNKLKKVDYIHVVIRVQTIENDSEELLSFKLKEILKKKNPKFLFLNIRGTGDNRIIGRFKKIFTDKVLIWIDTNLDLKDDGEISFTQNFYKILRENRKREITEVVTEARNDCNSFCRLAYVIKGSPHTTIIWACS